MSVKTESIINNFIGAIKESKAKTSPYDTEAEVIRVEGDTAWVHISGGIDETPVKMTINCEKGDKVQVRVGGGSAWLVGNATAPPTDDTTAIEARVKSIEAELTAKQADAKAEQAQTTADNATVIASQAKTIADDTNQYFWFASEGTDTGAHITEVPQDEFTDSTSPNYHSGGNLLARSNGIAIRDGLTELSSFSASSAQIGVSGGGHTVIQSSGMDIYGGDGTKNLAHIGYDTGNAQSGTAVAPFYSFGERDTDQGVGNYSVAEGRGVVATGYCSHAEGCDSQAKGAESHAEGYKTQATNKGSHSEGYSSTVLNILASGLGSHAEGYAYDSNTVASGIGSHAEGRETLAYGEGAHSEGYGTIAYSDHQHTQGKYNKQDTNGTYADIVGGGTSSARKNIEATTWTGDKKMKGDVYVGCNDDSTGGNKLSPVLLSGIADNQGCVTIGDLIIEWGLASITTSSSGTTTGGLTQYLGTAQVTFTNTFAYKPNVLLTWSANYNNQSVLNTYDVTTTGFYAYGRTLTGNTTRGIRWVAIGKKA